MKKPTIIQFNEPSQEALHFHDDATKKSTRKPIFEMDFEQMRRETVELYGDSAEQCKQQYCQSVTEETVGSIRHLRIEPKNLKPEMQGKVGIYFFGGGFVTGSPELDLIVSAPLAEALGLVILSPDYRLAPEHPFPAAVNDCIVFYRDIVKQYGAENVFVVGESAGAKLALTTVLRAHEVGLPLPQAVVCLSPVTDQTGDAFSSAHLYQQDPALFPETVDFIQRIYAPDTPNSNPMISPHFGAYGDWFPPILFTTGTRDAFQHQVAKSAEKMAQAGVDVTVHLWEGMWHVFEYYPELPEAQKSIKLIAEFVRAQLI